jgi:hypothetical protein
VHPAFGELVGALEKKKLPFNMTGIVQLDLFDRATWDIFHRRTGKLVQIRVAGVRFKMRHGWPYVESFSSCKVREAREGAEWVDGPVELGGFFYNDIVASRTMSNAQGKVECVVFPRKTRFQKDWIGTAFYPAHVDVEKPETIQVVGWYDNSNARFNEPTLNKVSATESAGGVKLRLEGEQIFPKS